MQKKFKSHFEEEEQFDVYRIKGLGKEKSKLTGVKKKKPSKKAGKLGKGDWNDNF